MEILKQEQYQPMPVAEQVVSLFVGVENNVADIAVGEVRRFEREWLRFVHEEHEEILETLRDRKELTDELRARLDGAVAEFKKRFGG